jgi:hypothetical protein
MDLTHDEVQQRAEADRREVNPPIQVDAKRRQTSHPCGWPARHRSFTLNGSKTDALALLDQSGSDFLLVDGSGSYQPAHVEGSNIEPVVARSFHCLGKPLKLSA